MPEPENHTLHLLREIRGAIAALESKLDVKIDRNHQDLTNRFDSIRQAMLGESVPDAPQRQNSTSGWPPLKSAFPCSSAAEERGRLMVADSTHSITKPLFLTLSVEPMFECLHRGYRNGRS